MPQGTLSTVNPISIPIVRADAPTEACNPNGCGGCLASAAGPVCRSDLGPLVTAPTLDGPPALLQQLVAELNDALAVQAAAEGAGQLPVAASLVHTLRLRDGEAELTLALAPRGVGMHLMDTAFQALRRRLPDTDIYVHALS